MTDDQKSKIVELYCAGKSYKEIYKLTGIAGSTAASYIRRKHRNLQRNTQHRRELHQEQLVTKIQNELKCTYAHAFSIYAIMSERFRNKQKTCLATSKEFTIKFSDLSFPEICPYLGIKIDYFEENYKHNSYPTFDRIDNTKGYIPGNVCIVSWRGNRLKSDSTYQELQLLATNLEKLHMQKEYK